MFFVKVAPLSDASDKGVAWQTRRHLLRKWRGGGTYYALGSITCRLIIWTLGIDDARFPIQVVDLQPDTQAAIVRLLLRLSPMALHVMHKVSLVEPFGLSPFGPKIPKLRACPACTSPSVLGCCHAR